MKVFMCYSRKDEAFVSRLSNDLRARGIDVWRDVDNIPKDISSNTSSWRNSVDKALRECTHLIIVLSPDSVASPEVTAEWNYALMNDRPVIPVLHRECEIPYRLYALNFWDVRQDYQAKIDQLAATLPQSSLAGTVQHQPVATAGKKPAKARQGGGRLGLVLGGAAIGVVLCVVIAIAIVSSLGNGGTATPPPNTTGGSTNGGGVHDLTATAAINQAISAVQQAVVAFDVQMRSALETGDTTGLSSVASGTALTDRLNAVDILAAAGNCHWVYDQRGITPGDPTFTSSTRAEVRAEVDRDGTVRCDDGPRHEYDFTGPYLADYVVEFLGGKWKVTAYSNVTEE